MNNYISDIFLNVFGGVSAFAITNKNELKTFLITLGLAILIPILRFVLTSIIKYMSKKYKLDKKDTERVLNEIDKELENSKKGD